jgi:hypothetical protein
MKNIVTVVLVAVMTAPLVAQWLNHPDSKIPRAKDGTPRLSAPAPRATNGRPDLSGVWAAEPSAGAFARQASIDPSADPIGADLQFISKYALNILSDVKPEDAPMRPEAAALFRQRGASQGRDIPTSHCLPGGVPFSTLIAPFKIVQTPELIVMLLEDNNPPRQIHTDGRTRPADPWPSWMGYSTGTWQGDTLVAETTGFNERSWLDAFGHPRSESMRIVERFRRRDVGHLDVEITIDDPKMYTRAFSVKVPYRLLPDTDVLESVCAENEKDRAHLDH